jgi:hypothetical protein
MANLVNSLIAHLLADPTIAALTSSRIGVEFDIEASGAPGPDGEAALFPAIAVAPQPNGDYILIAAQQNQVSFVVVTVSRSDAETIASRLAALFLVRYHYRLASGADSLLVIMSRHMPTSGIERLNDNPNAPWTFTDVYQFLIPFA